MLLSLLNPNDLKKTFPSAFYHRGNEYYAKGRVVKLDVVSRSDEIIAQVKGSRSQPYSVIVTLTGSPQKLHIRGVCTCAMRINCKHVVATLLQAINALSQPVALSFSPSVRDPAVDQWLSRLQKTLTLGKDLAPVVDETYQLCYLLNTSSSGSNGLNLQISLFRRLKSGQRGAPKKFSRSASSCQKHLYPIDHHLLMELEILKKPLGYARFSESTPICLNQAADETFLIKLLETGRCLWRTDVQSALTLGDVRPGSCEWRFDENGCQTLHWFLSEKCESLIFSVYGLWYWDKTQGKIGRLETGLDPGVTQLLFSAPKVSPMQAQTVSDWLVQQAPLSKLLRPKIFKATETSSVKPIPCLRLQTLPLMIWGDFNNRWEKKTENFAVAALGFRYDTDTVAWEDSRKMLYKTDDEKFQATIRDKQKEKEALALLVEMHWRLVSMTSFADLNKERNHYFLLDHENKNPFDFSMDDLPKLRARGWDIEIADDYPYRVVDEPIEEWYSSVEEGEGNDWFTLELGIMLKGEKINLMPVLQQLIQQWQKQLTLSNNALESILAPLPDGRFIALPVERLRKIFNVFIELYDKDSLNENNMLRLSKLQATRLLALEAAMGAASLRWLGGDGLRELAMKMSSFKGIATAIIPPDFCGKLRSYQLEGVSWLQFLREYRWGGVLADDMGLGKTVQALAHLLIEKNSGRATVPSLVVAPTSLMFNWRQEAERFCPTLKVLVWHGVDRKTQILEIPKVDLILTTYPLLGRDQEILLKQPFFMLILDEAQGIKNSKSLVTQHVQRIQAHHRLCLTGTPLENHLGELWSLFHFLMPGLLGEQKRFQYLFRTPIEKQANTERREHLARRIAPFLLRRTKDKVAVELPEKVEMIRYVELEGEQRDLYETVRLTMQKKLRRDIAKMGLARSHIMILDALLKLRQICCDPRLLKMKAAAPETIHSAKLELLMTFLPELLEEGRRILLFSQFTGMLALIEEELQQREINYVKLTGSTKDRETPVRQFQVGKVPLFLISLKAGGTGLNLTSADTVIHYDPWWNPAVENQATDRAHRIGQSKTVFVYKFVAKNTVEEKILQMQKRKRALMDSLLSGNMDSKLSLTEKDLQYLFDPV